MKAQVRNINSRVNPEEQVHISYSQLSTYLLCPMKYAHSYVYGTAWEQKPVALIFGQAIHRAVEQYYLYRKDTDDTIPIGHLIDFFRQSLDHGFKDNEVPISFKKGETANHLQSQGTELLKLFHAEVIPQQIIEVEKSFSVPIPDLTGMYKELPVRLVGRLDLIEADTDGTYMIVELKTAAQRYNALRIETDLQSTVYSYAMSQMNHATSENSCLIRYDVLLKTKEPAFEHYFVTRSERDHNRLIELLNQVLAAIEHRIFYRQTGWACADCQFRKICLG
ncbi:MAG: PD-(D/E)XK nuclease family protein [Deltaproteobacteria bacterium]|nr:PD-(D/E)XK nuclease family protein [Deltaproteobacteria bacterium]